MIGQFAWFGSVKIDIFLGAREQYISVEAVATSYSGFSN
jgi:hypothetical protein